MNPGVAQTNYKYIESTARKEPCILLFSDWARPHLMDINSVGSVFHFLALIWMFTSPIFSSPKLFTGIAGSAVFTAKVTCNNFKVFVIVHFFGFKFGTIGTCAGDRGPVHRVAGTQPFSNIEIYDTRYICSVKVMTVHILNEIYDRFSGANKREYLCMWRLNKCIYC